MQVSGEIVRHSIIVYRKWKNEMKQLKWAHIYFIFENQWGILIQQQDHTEGGEDEMRWETKWMERKQGDMAEHNIAYTFIQATTANKFLALQLNTIELIKTPCYSFFLSLSFFILLKHYISIQFNSISFDDI